VEISTADTESFIGNLSVKEFKRPVFICQSCNQKKALQMYSDRITSHKYKISHLKRSAMGNDLQGHSVITIAAII